MDEPTDLDYSSNIREGVVKCLTSFWRLIHNPVKAILFAWLTAGIPQQFIDLWHWGIGVVLSIWHKT